MEYVRRRLIESGVIGHVLRDFNPRVMFVLVFDDTRINIGYEVTSAQLQHPPTRFEIYYADLRIPLLFRNPKLVACMMTDPEAPGGEYLHWFVVGCICITQNVVGSRQIDVVDYEPPRAGTRMLVFTMFEINVSDLLAPPSSRENFNTTIFAQNNALGYPLGASFFYVR